MVLKYCFCFSSSSVQSVIGFSNEGSFGNEIVYGEYIDDVFLIVVGIKNMGFRI